MMRKAAKIVLLILFAGSVGAARAADADWNRVGEALGKPGKVMPGGIYKVALPRTDIKAMLDGIEIKPGFALGGWVAFAPMGRESMMMGDLVLKDGEVNPVMSRVVAGGVAVTALHNHLLRNRPFTMYMHVMGVGDPVRLATVLHNALAKSGTPLAPPAAGSSQAAPKTAAPATTGLDAAVLDRTLGAKGSNNDGILQYSIPRAQPVTELGMALPAAMGTAQSINFQSLGGGNAAITGDFVLTAKETAPVMKALRENGIEVTALHNHMTGEQPRLFFLHFWGHGGAAALARGLKAALSHVAIARG